MTIEEYVQSLTDEQFEFYQNQISSAARAIASVCMNKDTIYKVSDDAYIISYLVDGARSRRAK